MGFKNNRIIMEYRSKTVLFGFFLIFVSISYLLLVLPSQSYTALWLNDTMALLDASYRVSLGQIPSKDFVSAIGPINFYLSSAGLLLGFEPGVTFAIGCILALFIILLPGLLIMHSRFALFPTLISSVFFGLLIVAPLGSGETFNHISWAMYYNRQAWAALFFIFLFYVEPRSPSRNNAALDGILLSILVFFELYCKITYGLVVLSFIFANMFVSKYNRRVSFVAICFTSLAVLLTELVLHLNAGYISNILTAINARGSVRSGLWNWVYTVIQHADILISVALLFVFIRFIGRRNVFDWLFVIGCSAVCIILLDQNGGTYGIPALLAVFICFGELIYRVKNTTHPITFTMRINGVAISLIMLIIFIAKPFFHRIIAIEDHFMKSSSAESCVIEPSNLSSFCVQSKENLLGRYINKEESIDQHLNSIRADLKNILSGYEYALTINDGYQLIQSQHIPNPVIFVLDIADPFTFAFQLKPRLNGYPFKWTWPSDDIEVIFKGVTIVMEPKMPYEVNRFIKFKENYDDYLIGHFNKTATSKYWNLWISKI